MDARIRSRDKAVTVLQCQSYAQGTRGIATLQLGRHLHRLHLRICFSVSWHGKQHQEQPWLLVHIQTSLRARGLHVAAIMPNPQISQRFGHFIKLSCRDEVLGARSAATGMYVFVHEDCEHRATTQFARQLNL